MPGEIRSRGDRAAGVDDLAKQLVVRTDSKQLRNGRLLLHRQSIGRPPRNPMQRITRIKQYRLRRINLLMRVIGDPTRSDCAKDHNISQPSI